MRAVIYTRPTYHITGDAQNKAILGTFSCELREVCEEDKEFTDKCIVIHEYESKCWERKE